LFVMAWLSDFSDDSARLQYFRNPGSGTSAILVYTQFHRLFVVWHSIAHDRGRAATFYDALSPNGSWRDHSM
jgi:hypothetical protein